MASFCGPALFVLALFINTSTLIIGHTLSEWKKCGTSCCFFTFTSYYCVVVEQ